MSDEKCASSSSSSSSAFEWKEISVYDNGSIGIGISDPWANILLLMTDFNTECSPYFLSLSPNLILKYGKYKFLTNRVIFVFCLSHYNHVCNNKRDNVCIT
jgi:hypothetical protein